jgi:hypothetical protein
VTDRELIALLSLGLEDAIKALEYYAVQEYKITGKVDSATVDLIGQLIDILALRSTKDIPQMYN